MKDRLLYLMIGVLIGIVVMQWTMPSGQAIVTTSPVGHVVALAGDVAITESGEMWYYHTAQGWTKYGDLPFPINELHFATMQDAAITFIDRSGNYWDYDINRGQPPVSIPTDQSTLGKLKGKYEDEK